MLTTILQPARQQPSRRPAATATESRATRGFSCRRHRSTRGGALNFAAYVGNDPVNKTDPSGECEVTPRTKTFCKMLGNREREMVKPAKKPITPQQAAVIMTKVNFSQKGPSQTNVILGLPGYKLLLGRSARNGAEGDTLRAFPNQKSWNNRADAFKHANLSIRLSRAMGDRDAKQVLDAHERLPGNPPGEKLMDLTNNHNARILNDVFPNVSPSLVSRLALEAGLLQETPVEIKP